MFTITQKLYYRFIFAFKFKTLKTFKVLNKNDLYLSSSKGNYKIKRRCPHQGAFLEKGYIDDNKITCHWHGCKIYINIIGEKI